MLIEAYISLILGIIFGTIAGIIPGLHINLIATIMLILSGKYFYFLNNEIIIIFFLTMGIVYSFTSFIPGLVFGIPDDISSIQLLPNQIMSKEGRAIEALILNSIGSILGIISGILIISILFFYFEEIYKNLKGIIPTILIFIIILMIFLEKKIEKIIWAIIISLFSSFIGNIALNSYFINEPLLILFSGLFGIPGLLMSLTEEKNKIEQKLTKPKIKFKKIIPILSITSIISFFCSIIPGIGNAQSATIATLFFKKIKTEIQILILSSINSINFVLSLLTFYTINKSRNGIISAISQIKTEISFKEFLFFIFIFFIIGLISYFITIWIGKKIIIIYQRISVRKANIILIFFIISLSFYFSSFYGVLILLYSTILGLLTLETKIKRTHLMNSLLVPVLLNII